MVKEINFCHSEGFAGMDYNKYRSEHILFNVFSHMYPNDPL